MWIVISGVLTLLFAIMDIIHGQHNGDAHRSVIHAAELVCFIPFVCLVQAWLFRLIDKTYVLNRALIVMILSVFICILSAVLFGLSGGSVHGDGGPIAFTFLLLASVLGGVILPASLIAFVVSVVMRLRKRKPILAR